MKIMKTLMASVALATVIAAPALAQQSYRAQDQEQYGAYAAQNGARTSYRGAYATPDGRRHSPNPAWDVYDTTGQYVGSDPDPFIRDSIKREAEGGEYN
jgi:type II secretory pathway pseudopilin PulG